MLAVFEALGVNDIPDLEVKAPTKKYPVQHIPEENSDLLMSFLREAMQESLLV